MTNYSNFRWLRILIVEDNPVNRDVLTRQLVYLDHRVEHSEDGQQGLIDWRKGKYDLLLVDYEMPYADGPSLTRSIRREESDTPGKPRTPIMACSSHASPEDIAQALEAGMDGYLVKPITLDTLRHELHSLRSSGKGTAASRIAASIADVSVPIDWKLLHEMIADDSLERQIVQSFRQALPVEAAQLASAIQSANQDRMVKLAHRLRGTSATVCAMHLETICARIQSAARKEETKLMPELLKLLQDEVHRLLTYLRTA